MREGKDEDRSCRLCSTDGFGRASEMKLYDFWPEPDGRDIRFCYVQPSPTGSRPHGVWRIPCSVIDATPDDKLVELIETSRVQALILGEMRDE